MSLRNEDRARGWTRSFFQFYEVSLDECVAKRLDLQQQELHELFDIVASVKTMRKWQSRKSDQESILEKARPIIGLWRRGDSDLEDELFEAHKKVVSIYYKA